MTNSTTSSSNESGKARNALESFLLGNLSVDELGRALESRVTLDFEQAPIYRKLQDISLDEIGPISVTKAQLITMLDRFCLGTIQAGELSNWAALLIALPVFVPEGETEEQQWDASNGPVWDILHHIATPNVFGELTFDVVSGYLKRLQSE